MEQAPLLISAEWLGGAFRVYRAPRCTDSPPVKVDALRTIADEKGSNPARVTIAWVLSHGIDIVPLVGARKRTQLKDASHAPELQLTVNDPSRIETAVPAGAATGDRYPASPMAHLDSEQARG